MQALPPRSPTKEMVWPINCWKDHRVIRVDPRYPPQKLYETLTVYFPAKLDGTTMKILEDLAPECSWRENLVPNPRGKFHGDEETLPEVVPWTGEGADLIMVRVERPLSQGYPKKNPHIRRPPGPIGETPTKLKFGDSGNSHYG